MLNLFFFSPTQISLFVFFNMKLCFRVAQLNSSIFFVCKIPCTSLINQVTSDWVRSIPFVLNKFENYIRARSAHDIISISRKKSNCDPILGNRDQSRMLLEHIRKLNIIETTTLGGGGGEKHKLSQSFCTFIQTTFTLLRYLFLEPKLLETKKDQCYSFE